MLSLSVLRIILRRKRRGKKENLEVSLPKNGKMGRKATP
jgi:hypothetical protein